MAVNASALQNLTASLSDTEVMDVCLIMLQSKNIDLAHFLTYERQSREKK